MDFFQAQDFFKQAYPDKKVTFTFDEKCHRFYELTITDGKANPVHHIENNKVRVDIEGLPSIYAPIMPHRECCTLEYMIALIDKAK